MNETVIQFEKFHQLQENDCQQKNHRCQVEA
jgi:hypothetical protein